MYARIIEGRVAELSEVPFALGPSECALIVECPDEVKVGWVFNGSVCAAPNPDTAILAQIAELEAMQTPRLLREAMLGKECVVLKPGCCINGMSPAVAVAHLDENLDILRAQLAGELYYQTPD